MSWGGSIHLVCTPLHFPSARVLPIRSRRFSRRGAEARWRFRPADGAGLGRCSDQILFWEGLRFQLSNAVGGEVSTTPATLSIFPSQRLSASARVLPIRSRRFSRRGAEARWRFRPADGAGLGRCSDQILFWEGLRFQLSNADGGEVSTTPANLSIYPLCASAPLRESFPSRPADGARAVGGQS